MSSVSDKKLVDNESLAGAGPHLGSAVSLERKWTDLIAVCTCANAAGNTADVIVQHSPDGINWYTLGTIPQVVANAQQIVAITAAAFPQVRARTTLGGAVAGDVTVKIYYDKR